MNQLSLSAVEIQYALGLSGAFVGVFLALGAAKHFLIRPILLRRQINQRLRGNKKEQEARAQIFKAFQEADESPVLAVLQKLIGWGKVENLQTQMLQADIYMNPGAFLTMICLLASLGFLVGMVVMNMLWGLGAALGLGVLPLLFLRWRRQRKAVRFEKQMPEAMDLIARSLRAGHTLSGTLDLVSQEIPAPLGTEMRVTYEEQRLGLSMGQALRRMGDRVDSRDLKYFVTAVLIQTETGGNLAEILENIGHIIRERLKLKGKIRGLTAEGRFSAVILSLLPVVTFGALFMLNPQYVNTMLSDPMGYRILGVGILSILMGALVMKRMVNIKV